MSDLIDREQAIQALEKGFIFHSYAGGMAKRIVENLPSAEKTGRWVPIVSYTKDGREKTQWGCSECGQGMFQFGQRFCSNCGIRMEE